MNSPVINSQSEHQARSTAPELIVALELAVEHWDDLTPTQRENAFRIACESIPGELRAEAAGKLFAILFEGMATTTAH